MKRSVTIVSTGLANIASVCAALERLGVRPIVSSSPAEVRASDFVLLPGVGALGPAMQRLSSVAPCGDTLAAALLTRVRVGRPTLAICLGLQLLCESSAEAPGVAALGCFQASVERLDSAPSLPHFGWNEVVPERATSGLPRGYAYFAHSFGVRSAPPDCEVAWTSHGDRFVSVLRRDAVLACQFHPELSGAYGAGLLSTWLGLETSVLPC